MTTKTHKPARHALPWTMFRDAYDRLRWNVRPTDKRVQR